MGPRLDILLADDDHNDRALFGIAVDKTDLNIWLQTVTDSDQAVAYLEGRDVYADRSLHPVPDMVVLDYGLCLSGGVNFFHWRRASRAFSSLPVVIFSGLAYQETIESASAMSADAFIAKPFEFAGWKAVVRQIWDFGMECRECTAQNEEGRKGGCSAAKIRD
jgi:DNA-binding response OmpR family regulator